MKLSEVWPEIERVAGRHGVLRVGASDPRDDHADLFTQWLDQGREAGMAYLRRNRDTRLHPETRFPWARSAIVITIPYGPDRADNGTIESAVARYAQGDDYHLVLDEVLRALEAELKRLAPDVQTRRYVDTGPLSDRALAAQSGLGWIGRNGMLIDPEHGSYIFIGTLLTSFENDLHADLVADRCGACRRCIEACPTDAILPDRTVASAQCISYATIEHRGPLPDTIKDRLHGNVFGCDICNEVCPWNEAPAAGAESFGTRSSYRARPISDLLRVTQADFSSLFRRSAVKRARRVGMIRNAILVAPEISPETAAVLECETDDGIRDALRWRRKRSASDL